MMDLCDRLKQKLVHDYLTRIKLSECEEFQSAVSANETLKVLFFIQKHHVRYIPFENLSLYEQKESGHHSESVIKMHSMQDLMQKLVHHKRGGICFEQNMFMSNMIQLIFPEAKVSFATCNFFRPPQYAVDVVATHVAVLVDNFPEMVNGKTVKIRRLLCDVGFSKYTPDYPIMLDVGKDIQKHNGRWFRVEEQVYQLKADEQEEYHPGVHDPTTLKTHNCYVIYHRPDPELCSQNAENTNLSPECIHKPVIAEWKPLLAIRKTFRSSSQEYNGMLKMICRPSSKFFNSLCISRSHGQKGGKMTVYSNLFVVDDIPPNYAIFITQDHAGASSAISIIKDQQELDRILKDYFDLHVI